MGLTVHFTLKLPATLSLDEVTAAIAKLWQAAKTLPFQSQSPMVTLDEARISHALADRSRSPWRWACIQHTHYHQYRFDSHGRPYTVDASTGSGTCSQMVRAQTLVGFTCLPGSGCEQINLFVGTYPASFLVECEGDQHGYPSGKRRLMLDSRRWVGSAFCKTQYASQPEEGGITNFLRCHLLVIAVLEAARDLGFQVEVRDEGNYWEQRSIPELVGEIGNWNMFILGIGKRLQGMFDGQVQTAIDEATMAQPVNEPAALALGDDVLDLIRRTRGNVGRVAEPVARSA
jgi:hypothetical protein